MSMTPAKLQNISGFPGNPLPTIVITIKDENWNEAYANWKEGKNPTTDPRWKLGVFMCFECVEEREF